MILTVIFLKYFEKKYLRTKREIFYKTSVFIMFIGGIIPFILTFNILSKDLVDPIIKFLSAMFVIFIWFLHPKKL